MCAVVQQLVAAETNIMQQSAFTGAYMRHYWLSTQLRHGTHHICARPSQSPQMLPFQVKLHMFRQHKCISAAFAVSSCCSDPRCWHVSTFMSAKQAAMTPNQCLATRVRGSCYFKIQSRCNYDMHAHGHVCLLHRVNVKRMPIT